MEKNVNVYYVVWEDRGTAQVVRVSALTELGAVALASPRCKCHDRSWVRVFTEEQLKQAFGKRKSCRCYGGDELIVYVEEINGEIKISNTQYSEDNIDGVSKLLSTLLLKSYENQSKIILGSTKGFPSICIKAYAYDVEYAEPYIE